MSNENTYADERRQLLELLLHKQTVDARPSLVRRPRPDSIPLSFAQQRLWLLAQLDPDSAAYNFPLAVRLRGTLDAQALRKALDAIVLRHEALRTTFVSVEGGPVQVISPGASAELIVEDLSDFPEAERDLEAKRRMSEAARRPFDLSTDTMLRAHLLRLGNSDHALALTVHHIASDGWSQGLLFRDLGAIYRAFATGQEPELPELPIQYADYAIWQREWLRGETLQRQLSYWNRRLAGAPPVLDLPMARRRPSVQTFAGAWEKRSLSKGLSEALRELSRREGVTLYMMLLAAFQTLLHRYTAQDDIVVGSPIAGRSRKETEELIGFFVNTLVMRGDLSGDPTFRELLGRIRQMALEAYEHQDLPFEKLVEELEPPRNLSHSPVFQVVFALQNMGTEAPELPGLDVAPMWVDTRTARFDMTLYVLEEEEGLAAWLEYNTDLFDAGSTARFLGHYETLLEGIAEGANRRVSELPLLPESERRQILLDWNATEADYPRDRGVHEFFEEEAGRAPDALAVVFGEAALRYGELDRRANRLAHFLRRLGVGPEVLVGVCMDRSLEMVVGVLGILKAGGAYVPLDPTYPQERLAFILGDSQAPVVVTEERFRGLVSGGVSRVVSLDGDREAIDRESDKAPRSGVGPENLAYVIYTSGSTGKPKGVEIRHESLVNLVAWHQGAYGVTSSDRATQVASPAFDASVWEIWPYLTAGASIHIPDEETRASAAKLCQWLRDQRIDICFLPTPLAESVLQEPVLPGSLRFLLTGGDKLHRPPRRELPFQLVNHYGPTESTVVATAGLVLPESEGSSDPSIGRPIANTRTYILDAHMQPVPVGVAGELYVGGAGLARGYWRRPELTAERFVPDPFGTKPGARLYKTGDLVRYLPDGSIEFLGRSDDQVKVRGFRIELGEVEAALAAHPGVRESVVVLREDEPGEKRLVAYWVGREEAEPSLTELRGFLRSQLPEYMVPSAFMRLEGLPLTPNGKVDRRALPAPGPERPALEERFVPPSSSDEQTLARIWAEVLRLERVGIHDNFFELGGDSILSMQIIAKANQAGLQLAPRQVFQFQTVAELAAAAGQTSVVRAEQGEVAGPVHLTPIQSWFFEQGLADAHHFNQAILLEARRPLDPALLEQALPRLVAHHDALRLRFERIGAAWEQSHGSAAGAVSFSRVDLAALAGTEQAAAVEATMARLQSGLDLARGPLFRAALLDLGSAGSRLLLVIHHLVVDGVSWRVLLEDLETAYQQLAAGRAVSLPRKTTSFRQWAERLAEYGRSERLESEAPFWVSMAKDQAPILPVDDEVGPGTVASERTVVVSLSEADTAALLQVVPAAYQTQINDVLLTALLEAFWRRYGLVSLLIDLEGHGREAGLFDGLDVSRTVGWFTTVYPVLLRRTGDIGSPEALVPLVREQLRGIPNRGIGYGLLRYSTGNGRPTASLQATRGAAVRFNYLGQFDQMTSNSALFANLEWVGSSRSPNQRRSHSIDVNGAVMHSRLEVSWSYSENAHRREAIERLAQAFLDALGGLIGRAASAAPAISGGEETPELTLSQDQMARVLAEMGDGTGLQSSDE